MSGYFEHFPQGKPLREVFSELEDTDMTTASTRGNEMTTRFEYVWVADAELERGKVERIADCQPTRESAIVAARNWFAINGMGAVPFSVTSRPVEITE